MCGIAGIISKDPSQISVQRLKRMTDALAHRGPDGEGHWIHPESTVGLGNRRLAIIDLSSAGNQPMHYAARYTITYNGEIYNYRELRDELKQKGHEFRSQTDTEVILAAYDQYGEECVDHLDGMFAFAIWDEKKNELFAARDRFGEKPFFYFNDGNQFLFASEMKALWAAGIEKKANLKLLFNFLTIGYVDNPSIPGETFYEKISKLPAASILKYSLQNGLSIDNYWDIDPEYQLEKVNEKNAIAQFSELLTRSIKNRYRSDVKVGTSLSGGLDSSSVIAISNQVNAESDSHRCFTAVFSSYEKDESQYAKRVANRFNLEHFITEPEVASMINDLDKVFYYQEEPYGSSSTYAQFRVYKLAIENKTKVLLDGQGADETLAGYNRYYKWYWQELFRKGKLLRSKELKYATELGVKEGFSWKNRVAALAPEFASIVLERQYLLNALRHEDLHPEFIRYQSKEAYYSTPPVFSLNGALYFNTCMHGLEELLRYADRNSMAHGCEVRLPFLDHELVEFVFSLPSNYKIRKGWTKWILRQAISGRLDDDITWRKDKIGFEPPQLEWMQHPGMVEKILEARKKLVDAKILKQEVLNKPLHPTGAYDADNYDWKFLTAAYLF